jgi:uncharacterized protein YbbK (DUF523 family)
MGNDCKYSGGNNRCEWVVDFAEDKSIVEICPEELGGLSTPRPPAELVDGKVINSEGKDVTIEFQFGAKRGYEIASTIAAKSGDIIEGAILKAKSPSCGCGKIYGGTFTHTVIDGDGCFARLLKEQGIKVITEEDEKF